MAGVGAEEARMQREQLGKYLQWVKDEGGVEGPTHLDTMFQAHQQKRLQWLRDNVVGTILECGCCYGFVLAYVGGHIGVDHNPHSIELARILNPRKEFVCAGIQALPFPDKCVDTVMFPDVLEHVAWDDVPKVLTEAKRVARQKILITLPSIDSSYAQSPKHQWIASPDKVKEMVRQIDGQVTHSPSGFVGIQQRLDTARGDDSCSR